MATALFIIVVVLSAIHIVITSATDDKRVYESLSKKQLYKLSIIKDIISSIIILLLVILPFIG